MAVEQEQIRGFLPTGDDLRAMISQSFLTPTQLKSVLASKGIFIDENDKNKSVPLLMTSLLTPREFGRLVENQVEKEDKFKTNTLVIPCQTDKKLMDIIPASFSLNKIIDENVVYKPNYIVKGNPQFTQVDGNPNLLQLSYEIERHNKTKDWASSITTHKANITIEKKSGGEIGLVLTKSYTSRETDEINEMLLKTLKNHFKDANVVKEETDYIRIKFNDFTNRNRIQFFNSFTSPSLHRNLEFLEITDINIQLDESVTSPVEIKDFINGINSLKISGKELQEHLFIKNENLHDKVIVSSTSFKYKFDMIGTGIKGIVDAEFAFPAYQFKEKRNAELQFNLVVVPDKEIREHANNNKLHKEISKFFENYKLEQFEKYKIKDAN